MSSPVAEEGPPLRVVVADDSAVYLRGLVRAMNRSPLFEVVGTTATGVDVPGLARALLPDVAVLDRRLPGIDGAELSAVLAGILGPHGGVAVLISAEPVESSVGEAGSPGPRVIDKALSRRQILDAVLALHERGSGRASDRSPRDELGTPTESRTASLRGAS